jgi:secreted PhoX family phosphatase
MKHFLLAFAAIVVMAVNAYGQAFDQKINVNWITDEVIMPTSPLTTQILFVGAEDMVQTVDDQGRPNGTQPAKQWHDFIGFTPDETTNDLGWVSVNHEMILADDKIGDGGGMTVFKVRRASNGDLEIVEQTLADGRQGKFFNVDFVNTVGETGMNCGGITSSADGRIWTAEEWWQGSNEIIYAGGEGFRDTTDFTISTDIPGDFDGATISKVENLNYMVEIDPKTAKAVRKQYNWGRQPFEGGCILPDNRTVFTGSDDTPGFLTKFVADEPGDFTRGKTYVYRQMANSYRGEWVEIDNTKLENMLNFKGEALKVGATMFNRLEWVAYNEMDGKVYMTETGRDYPWGKWEGEVGDGGAIAKHHYDRAANQGNELMSEDYWDFYGRVLVLDPETAEVNIFLEGGPFYGGLNVSSPKHEKYPEKHLSNPDGLNFMYVNGKAYMVICEDLNGTSFGRVPIGVANRTCELWLHDMENAPEVDNLTRLAVVPIGAEVTGACATPDGKSLLVNSQHPAVTNAYPFNNSLTFVINGWDKVLTSIETPEDDDKDGFSIWPNPVSRELKMNKTTDAAIYDIKGNRVKVVRNTSIINVENLTTGTYFVKTIDGDAQKVIIK